MTLKDNLGSYPYIVNQIKGWFVHEQLLDVYDLLNNLQRKTTGDLLEIGVYNGKSFIPLLGMAKPNETCIGIDVFEEQYLNLDNSGGYTTINIVEQNIYKVFSKLPKHLKLIKQDSQSLTSKKLLELSTNKIFRYISIDGCHTYDCTLHDLKLAANCITEDGIILIDDYTCPNFPGVKAAVDYFLNMKNNLQPVYCGGNKIILCPHEVSSDFYKELKSVESNIIKRKYIQHNRANMWKGIVNIYK